MMLILAFRLQNLVFRLILLRGVFVSDCHLLPEILYRILASELIQVFELMMKVAVLTQAFHQMEDDLALLLVQILLMYLVL